ncbi:family 20 glycosylhydrolase [candidate division KSB1 bacterium]|nr:family 20 glycosylhydrolase [candidate division KSB1 bacterium]
MRKSKFLILCIGIIAIFLNTINNSLIAQKKTSQPFQILPQPQEMEGFGESFEILPSTVIRFYGISENINLILETINQTLIKHQFPPLKVAINGLKRFNNSINFILFNNSTELPVHFSAQWQPEMDQSGYLVIIAATNIQIYAKSSQGLYYAALSLRQLFQTDNKKAILPGLIIRDWPCLKMRGVSLDISRGQVPTLDNFKKQIQFLSEYKLNILMLYIEDMFVYLNHPHIGLNRGALTPHEIAQLQQFAQQHFIEIIPVLQTAGHLENILLLPQYRSLAEFPGAAVLKMDAIESIDFIESLIQEVAPAFNSEYFHIGGDECYDAGRGFRKIFSEEQGRGALLSNHFQKVCEILNKYSKKVIIYGDMLRKYPEILQKLPANVIIQDWQYSPKKYYPSIDFFTSKKRELIVSPGLLNWRLFYPDYANALSNIESLVRQGQKAQALGAITASWGDLGGENFNEYNWYGYAFSAECSWHNHPIALIEFNAKFFRLFYNTNQCELDSIYQNLNLLAELTTLADFWTYPFQLTPTGRKPKLAWITQIRSIAYSVRRQIKNVTVKVNDNRYHLHYLDFVARRAIVMSQQVLYAYEIIEFSQAVREGKKNGQTKNIMLALAGSMIHELKNIKATFEKLWLLQNKKYNLERILELYDRQIAYWLRKVEEIKKYNYIISGEELANKWIFHPARDLKTNGKDYAVFMKVFHIDDVVTSFQFQTIGQSHLRIYFNGNFIGEQIARPSVSLIVEKERVKLWNVTTFIQKGENQLHIEVFNYDPGEIASINVYGEIVFQNNPPLKFFSDSSWLTNTYLSAVNGNNGHAPKWISAAEKKSRCFISPPDFENGILSTIEWRTNRN